MKTMKKVVSLVLSVIMLMSFASVSFAADEDYSFSYYFADENFESVHVTDFEGTVPADGYVVIPETIDEYVVTGIGENTFLDCKELKGVVVSEFVTYIDVLAFAGCEGEIDIVIDVEEEEEEDDFNTEDWYESHKQDYVINGTTLVSYKGTDEVITIPYNCDVVADGAFKGNTTIKTVYIEKELDVIGASAFEGCVNLEEVVANSGVSDLEIGKDAFKGTPWLENYPSDLVILGTTLVKYKGDYIYLAIPNVITSVADYAFEVADEKKNVAFKLKVPVTIENFGEDCFFLYDSITPVYPEIVVYKDSTADKYCADNNLECVYAALPGDADANNDITAADARYVLRVSAKIEKPVVDDELMQVLDISGDSKIAANDARLVLRIAAQLDDYSVDQLLRMPRTSYEILFAATDALALARDYGCAYSKLAYQSFHDVDMNANTKTYFNMYNKELTSEKKAQTVTYNQDSQEAYDNLFEIKLLDANAIESYSSVIEDGVYTFRIELDDETVSLLDISESNAEKMLPAESAYHFTDMAAKRYWYNNSINGTMTYKDCVLEIKVEIATGKVLGMNVVINYDFAVTGSIMGIGISGSKGYASSVRTDVIKYTNFVYFTK